MKQKKTLFDHAGMPLKHRRVHGGRETKGHRKLERPLSHKKPIHLVLKSSSAVGPWSFLAFKNKTMVEDLIRQKAKKWGVRIGDMANVGNHIHLKVSIHNRKTFQNFLRSVTTMIARKVTGACRGNKLGKPFWDGQAYTRVLSGWTEEVRLRGYFIANRQEAAKGPKAREKFLKAFNLWVKTFHANANAYSRDSTA